MNLSKLIVFSGPSGSGKSTVVNRLLSDYLFNAEFSVSAASRVPRMNEKNGLHYYFITKDEFLNKINNDEFVEWQEVYGGKYYGTLKTEVERIRRKGKHVLFDIDAVGGINIKKMYGNEALSIFIEPPSVEVLRQRLEKRGTETAESMRTRLAKAEYEINLAKQFDYQVVNNDLEIAVDRVKVILEKELAFI